MERKRGREGGGEREREKYSFYSGSSLRGVISS